MRKPLQCTSSSSGAGSSLRHALFLLLFAIGVVFVPVSRASEPPVITIDEIDGFHRVRVPMKSFQLSDGGRSIELFGEGELEGRPRAISIRISPNALPERAGVQHAGLQGMLEFPGQHGATLLHLLSVRLPGPKLPPALAAHTFDCIVSAGELEKVAESQIEFELFDLMSGDRYSEMRLILDVPAREIVLAEKNLQYREDFFRAFARGE